MAATALKGEGEGEGAGDGVKARYPAGALSASVKRRAA
jgi:hypothetical protein